ncbi:hypothetical protein [Xanthomonas sp. WHRI 7945]|nr:hypothetical protein [Xanthomonas campestris pv. campestris]
MTAARSRVFIHSRCGRNPGSRVDNRLRVHSRKAAPCLGENITKLSARSDEHLFIAGNDA